MSGKDKSTNGVCGERTSEFMYSTDDIEEITDQELAEIERPLFGPEGALNELFERFGDSIEFDYRGRKGVDALAISILSEGNPVIDDHIAKKLFRGELIYDENRAGYTVVVYRQRTRGAIGLFIHDMHEDSKIAYRLQPDSSIELEVLPNEKSDITYEGVATVQAQLYAKRFADFILHYEPPEGPLTERHIEE